MDYDMLCKKREQLKQLYERIPKEALQSFEKSFEIEYTHNSTAIEGNTLSLIQTKAVLEDGLSVGGKTLREIYEVVNHKKAFEYVKKCVSEGKALDENIIKDIHALLMENILTGGIYRNVEVRITGAMHKPPVPSKMYQQIKNFYADMQYAAKENVIELAAWTHAEFVKIHPFQDGNGRVGRLIMFKECLKHGIVPFIIEDDIKMFYYRGLKEWKYGKGYLRDTCLSAQDKYKAYLDYFRIAD